MIDNRKPEERDRDDNDEVFDRQYHVYKEANEQRGLSEGQADQAAAEKLETGAGERAGAHRDRD